MNLIRTARDSVSFVYFFCAALLLLTESAPVAAAEGDVIKVITYNVQFLPGPARAVNKRKLPEYRAEQIGKEMAKFDIVGLNETFDDAPREIIIKQLKEIWGEDYHAVVHPRPDPNRFNGGLLIASKLPILDSHFSYYANYSDPKKYGFGADGFAAKGVLHARIGRSGDGDKNNYVDVFITHMEARDDDIRLLQYPEMGDFIKKHSDPLRPCLIMGDMNTRALPPDKIPEGSPYALLVKTFTDARTGANLLDVWSDLHGAELGGTTDQESTEIGKRIDYIFVSNPPTPALQLKPLTAKVNPYIDPQVKFLSDHSAVEAEFAWPRSK